MRLNLINANNNNKQFRREHALDVDTTRSIYARFHVACLRSSLEG
jgi:hypothetical protein